MAKSKKSSASNTKIEKYEPVSRGQLRTGRVHVPNVPVKITSASSNRKSMRRAYTLAIRCVLSGRRLIPHRRWPAQRENERHGYFEILFLCSGSANCHIQDRLLPFSEGDLAIVGSTLYHRVECQSSTPLTIARAFL